MRPRLLQRLPASLLVWAASFSTAADLPVRETGRPLLKQYSFSDYHAHFQVWGSVQDRAGLLYFGNKGCVLQYDGVTWRNIPVPAGSFVRSLTLGNDGVVYVGGVDELGYLATSPTGEKAFVSLREQLPEASRLFGEIWDAATTPDGVFFSSSHLIFRWRDGRFHLWPLEGNPIPHLYVIGRDLYMHRVDGPLFRLQGDEFVPIGDGPKTRAARLRMLVALPDDRLLAATAYEGLLTFDRDGHEQPFPTDADAWLQNANVRCGTRVGNFLLVGSARDGVRILDLEGHFVRHLDRADGLRDSAAYAILPTPDGGIWLSLNNGIARIQLPPDQTIFTREQGFVGGTVHSAARHAGTLYAATVDGVYRLQPAEPAAGRNGRFVLVPGLDQRSHSLLSLKDGLLVGENERLLWLPDDGSARQTLISGPSSMCLAESRTTPGRVWVGTSGGFMAFDRTPSGWRPSNVSPKLGYEVRTIVEADDGTLWLGSFTRGIARLRWAPGSAEPTVEFYKGDHGLPPDDVSFHVTRAGPVLFAQGSGGGVFRWDQATDTFRPVPFEAGRPGPIPDLPSAWLVSPAHAGANENIRELTADGRCRVWEFPELLETAGPLNRMFDETTPGAGRVLWLAGAEGLGRIQVDAARAPHLPPGLVLQRAQHDEQTAWPAERLLPAGPHRMVFEYSASATARAAEFSTRLRGLEDEWTSWSAGRAREFSNLPPGHYTFEVRVREGDLPGREPVAFAFGIAAPWWATVWARVGYILLAAAAVVGVIRWRLSALRNRAAELERTITRRTAELQSSNELLQIARDSADAANRAKSVFLAHMSHELRTPLNGILGYAQILARDPAQGSGARERLRVINDSGQHLLALINEVLDLARVESGKMPLHVATCALPSLVEGVVDLMRAPSDAAGLKFEAEIADDLPRLVRTDEQKLRQVLLNLLGNAVKFTRRGGVRFLVRRSAGGRLHFAVVDSGPGIAADRLSEIFQPFSTSAADNAQGTGLGLALSQRMVELLGGRLHVESAVGKGSRFWFELPLVETTGEPPAAAPVVSRPPLGYEGPRRHLLVVDDDPINRAVLRELLEPLGFSITEAADAAETFTAVRARRPDAVLLDLRFRSGPSGFAIARTLRTDATLAGLKVIAVSASVFENDRHDALAAGCDDFLAKPFQEPRLHAVLAVALGLTWIVAAEAPAVRAASEAPPLPDDVREELLRLAREGDAWRLQARLAELAATPQPPAGLARLQELAAGFQMKRLRDLLSQDAEDHPHR